MPKEGFVGAQQLQVCLLRSLHAGKQRFPRQVGTISGCFCPLFSLSILVSALADTWHETDRESSFARGQGGRQAQAEPKWVTLSAYSFASFLYFFH